MTLKSLIAAAATLAAMTSQPAQAYQLSTSGRTLASPQLKLDILRTVARYSKRTSGCAFLFSAQMEIMPPRYRPVPPTISATVRGGHYERWTVNGCGGKQRFQVGMWPSPRGGSDFAITPLGRPVPLHAR